MPTAIAPVNKPGKKIGAREAADAAVEYFRQLFSASEFQSISLEEVELSEDGKYWLITLGYDVHPKSGIAAVLGPPKTKFKVLKVDTRSGQVVAMKIRKLE
jgi:hypothetical protein